MTREEAVKVLAVLKTTYPNSYKGLTKEDAKATASVWALQFARVPYQLVSIALQKVIATSPYPPTVADIHEKLRAMYKEAYYNLLGSNITEKERRLYEAVEQALAKDYSLFSGRTGEPSLCEMLESLNGSTALEAGKGLLEEGAKQ